MIYRTSEEVGVRRVTLSVYFNNNSGEATGGDMYSGCGQ